MRTTGEGGALVVHLLSHGDVGQGSGALYLVARDGGPDIDCGVDVEAWLRRVEDPRTAPLVLLLLDTCHAGTLVDAQWHARVRRGRRRAWVIGAAAADEQAYHGRFSQAVAAVLRDLAANGLDVDPSVEFVPLSTLARRVDQELAARCREGSPQRLTVTPAEVGSEPALPFFPNPNYNPAALAWLATTGEAPLRDFVEIDAVLDVRHYLGRALGRPGQADLKGACYFTGRNVELPALAWWLDGDRDQDIGLRVVTGSPGVGKSTLLGVLVCAAHPQLQQTARSVRERVGEERLPGVNAKLAAVHARGRQLGELVTSLARQLHLDNPASGGWTAAGLVTAIAAESAPARPVVVVDALDEAAHPTDVMEAAAAAPGSGPTRRSTGMSAAGRRPPMARVRPADGRCPQERRAARLG